MYWIFEFVYYLEDVLWLVICDELIDYVICFGVFLEVIENL